MAARPTPYAPVGYERIRRWICATSSRFPSSASVLQLKPNSLFAIRTSSALKASKYGLWPQVMMPPYRFKLGLVRRLQRSRVVCHKKLLFEGVSGDHILLLGELAHRLRRQSCAQYRHDRPLDLGVVANPAPLHDPAFIGSRRWCVFWRA